MYKLGLVSVSFRKNSPREIIKAAKEAGLLYIEWGSDVHAPCKNTEGIEKINSLQKEYGILCSSYGTYFRLGETDLAELEDYIFAAKLLGTDVLRLWCGNKNSQEYGSDEKNALFEQCREAAKTAEKNGVKLCMECHSNTYTNTADSALELMQSVNSSSFKMYWQPNQFCSEEENLQYAEKISPYCEHIHVFNWRGEERFPLSEGMAMWKKYVGKFDTDKTLLLEFMPDDRKESLPFEAAALRRLAGV